MNFNINIKFQVLLSLYFKIFFKIIINIFLKFQNNYLFRNILKIELKFYIKKY